MVRTVCSAAVDNKTKVTSAQQLNKCQGRERNVFADEREARIAQDYCVKLFHLEWAKTKYEANNNILIITIFFPPATDYPHMQETVFLKQRFI